MTIEGFGSSLVRDAAEQYRFFYIQPSGTLIVRNLTIEDGYAPGGSNGSDGSADAVGKGGRDGGSFHNLGHLILDRHEVTPGLEEVGLCVGPETWARPVPPRTGTRHW